MQRSIPRTGSFRTVVLRAVDDASFGRTLSATTALGRAYGAHIVGLATLPRTILVPAGTPGVSDVARLDGSRRAAKAEHARMVPVFHRRCNAEALTADWIIADADESNSWTAASRVTRAADLIVAPTPLTPSLPLVREHDTEDLLLSSGRPLLLLPRGAELRGRPERILVAWNASREAARAVFDALPLLQSARVVTIANVGCQERPRATSMTDLARTLQRHGVPVLINEIDVAVREVGAVLLAAAKADGAELLVMGGYGRSRYSELVLGGTTRHVLRHTHLPVLISH